MTIFVGSTNPVKINAVKHAVHEKYPDAKIIGIDVKSGINEQPLSDEETQDGATNRARAVLKAGLAQEKPAKSEEVLGIGLEGGVFTNDNGEMWSTVWASVVTREGDIFSANGARIRVADIIADKIKHGEEMGPVMMSLTGEADVRKKQGMMGIVTNNFVTRTEEYAGIAKTAIGLWYGRDWAVDLETV